MPGAPWGDNLDALSKTHYEALGVPPTATQAEIRSAYRKLVLLHHPDRSKAPSSVKIFNDARDAHEILSDPEKRRVYDDTLQRIAKLKEEQARVQREPAKKATFGVQEVPRASADVQRLTSLFARGRLAEAENLAREICRTDPRQPIPYAILGDIARSRGNINEAAKMYAYAAQFDPTNSIYQRRYEQLLQSSVVVTGRGSSTSLEGHDEIYAAPAVGFGLVFVASGFVALSKETSVFQALPMISSWTIGVLFMIFFAGIAVGASLAIGNFLDRFTAATTNAIGNVGPAVILGAVALVNFWAAVLLYAILGLVQRAFNYSTTRLVMGVIVTVLLFTVASGMSMSIKPAQVLLWGGNLAYFGALIGWMVSDAFRG
jgi:curved DNA-binding protein CbpA